MFDVCKEIQSVIDQGNRILKECVPSYCCPYIHKIDFKNKSKSYWAKIGRNSKKHSGYFLRIGGLFSLIPDENIARIRFQSTIVHELIHTIPGCMNHGKKFHLICALINKKYPELSLQTSTSCEEYGIMVEKRVPKYIVKCTKCGKKYFYFRMPNYDLHNYVCNCCGYSKLKLLPYDKSYISVST